MTETVSGIWRLRVVFLRLATKEGLRIIPNGLIAGFKKVVGLTDKINGCRMDYGCDNEYTNLTG